jgi:hypothetical protein
MVQRRVVFYKWRNIPSKEAFNPEVAWTALRRRIEDEPEYAGTARLGRGDGGAVSR